MEFLSEALAGSRLLEAQECGAKVVLVGTYEEKKQSETVLHLEELERLTDTFGLTCVYKIACPLRKISAKTFLGKGKIEEIRQLALLQKATLIIFDDDISPQQQRNLEKAIQAMVVDRTELILAVFAQRAHTKEAKLQIALAQYQYQLPRLKRLWTHLGRQRVGGAKGGFLKGEGERQIEIDRRLLRGKISALKNKLVSVANTRSLQRKKRQKQGIVTFAIIGYTNAGKSTLFEALTKEKVLIEDKLFATLDTKAKSYILPNNQKILLIDTVGFIRKLPHHLIAAFKSTLEEALYADILLHLIDSTSVCVLEEMQAADAVLQELQADKKPIIRVLNKTEKTLSEQAQLLRFRYPQLVYISALNRKNLTSLLEAMMQKIKDLRVSMRFRFNQKDYRHAAQLMQETEVLSKEYEGNDLIIEANVPESIKQKFTKFAVKSCPSLSE